MRIKSMTTPEFSLPDITASNARFASTAQQARIQAEQLKLMHAILSKHPRNQPELIATHYVRHAQIAMHLKDAIEARKQMQTPSPAIEHFIESLTEEIKRGHANDLGIVLEWPSEPSDVTSYRPDQELHPQ